jgi:hypothetical protein
MGSAISESVQVHFLMREDITPSRVPPLTTSQLSSSLQLSHTFITLPPRPHATPYPPPRLPTLTHRRGPWAIIPLPRLYHCAALAQTTQPSPPNAHAASAPTCRLWRTILSKRRTYGYVGWREGDLVVFELAVVKEGGGDI